MSRPLDHPPVVQQSCRRAGISVIVPSYRGGEQLRAALESVLAQTIEHGDVEVVVVDNGPGAPAQAVVERIRDGVEQDGITWVYIRSESPGAGRARNIGLAACTREYVTFLDDDDRIEPDYLLQLERVAGPQTIAVTGITNLCEGDAQPYNTLEERIAALPSNSTDLADSPWVLGFVACKLIHWGLIADAVFPENLASGEDVVFFAQLLRRPNLKLRPVQDAEGARYLRAVTEGSVSRRDDFEFSVNERLDAIELIRGFEVPEANQRAQQDLVKAQAGFIARFHAQHADSPIGREALDAIAFRSLADFPWDLIDRGEAKTLVFAYCFPPDADTSSNVMAKRIMNAGDVVDVISNDMRAVREQDERFYGVIQRWVSKHTVLDTPTSFANWDAISNWAVEANRVASKSESSYESIYSRALWIASHVAAFVYKQEHPEAHWVAEFSDPLARGIDGQLRPGPIGDDSPARAMLHAAGWQLDSNSHTLFEVVEKATLAKADELVFTNEAQREVMLELYDEPFAALVRAKSTIAGHPVPRPELFSVAPCDYPLDQNVVNIAYFGAFYPNRGIGNVIDALASLDSQAQERIRLHIFTNSQVEIDTPVRTHVSVNGYRPYLEFLNLSRQLDVLLVTDTTTSGFYGRNPFLPSKYADYLGSNTPIWGVVETGSPLSKSQLAYVTEGDGVQAIADTLTTMLRDFRQQQDVVG